MLVSFGSSGDSDGEDEQEDEGPAAAAGGPPAPKRPRKAPGPRPWGKGEKRTSRVVFIGRKLDRAELERGLRACIA